MAGKSGLQGRYGGAALVTGASSGLGEAFARRLAKAGFDVVLVARRRERMEALAAELEKKSRVRCRVIAMDLGAAGAVEALFAEIAREGIDIGVVVNNAGFGTFEEFAESDGAEQAAMADLNCRAVVEVAHHSARLLKARGRGAIIITASVLGHFSLPFMATYSASKSFDLFLAEALWAELRPHGVHVQALCPGPTATEFSQRAHSPKQTGLRVMSCAEVVELSLRRLGGGPVVIPGWRNRLLVGMLRTLPSSIRMRILGMTSQVGRNRAA
jgi:short-subunit dehydrogenase